MRHTTPNHLRQGPPGPPDATLYLRFSPRPNADECESIETQEARCREYCLAKGYRVAHVFKDEELSGGTDGRDEDPLRALAARVGLWDALDSLKPGAVLVVRWRSRLARDVYVQEWIHRRALNLGARIEAADEGNGDSPQDKLVRQVLAAFDEYNRTMIRLMTSRGMLRNQRNGFRMGRMDRIPWGFQTDPADPARLIMCPTEQFLTKLCKAKVDEGMGLREIARWLNGSKFTRRNGRPWNHSAVRVILGR